MDYQERFIIGVCGSGRPVKTASDHCFVVDHGELVVQLVSAREAGGADV